MYGMYGYDDHTTPQQSALNHAITLQFQPMSDSPPHVHF